MVSMKRCFKSAKAMDMKKQSIKTNKTVTLFLGLKMLFSASEGNMAFYKEDFV